MNACRAVVMRKLMKTEGNDDYVIEMLNIIKEFLGVIANDDITLRLRG